MDWVSSTSLAVIALTWLFAWRVGYRWVCACGVRERTARWCLACAVPWSGLLFSAHLVGLAAMATGRGWFCPATVAAVYIVVARLSGWVVSRYYGNQPGSAPTVGCGGKLGWWWLPVAVVVGMYAVFLVDAVTRFPTGYDGLHYHLPNAVRWMQHGSIDLISGLYFEAMPGNGMILTALLASVSWEDSLTLIHLPAGVLVGLAVYGLARTIGGGRISATMCACIAMSIPVVLFQSFSSYIDLSAAAAWLVGLLALAWSARVSSTRSKHGLVVLAGLCAGISLGSKSTYLALTPLLGLVAVIAEWGFRRGHRHIRPAPFRHAALFAAAAMVCSGFWFVRGVVQAGNPVYPLEVKVGDHELLPGFTLTRWITFQRSLGEKLEHWWDYPWRESKYGSGYIYGVGNGVGAAFATFVPPGMLATLLFGVVRRRRSRARLWRIIVLGLSVSGAVMLVTILGEILRFVLPLLLVSTCGAALLVNRLRVAAPRFTLVAFTTALAITAVVACLKPASALAGRIADGTWDRASFYELPPLIENLAPGKRILNWGSNEATYGLLGGSLRNVVVSPAMWRLLAGDTPWDSELLGRYGIEYIFMQAPWPEDWPGDLDVELVYDNAAKRAADSTRLARLYRLLPTGKTAAQQVASNIYQTDDAARPASSRSLPNDAR